MAASVSFAPPVVEPPLDAAQRRLLLALGAATFMVSLDGRVVAPLLPNIAEEFGVSTATAGHLVSGYLLPYGACQLLYGPLADRFGKVRVAAFAMIAFSVGTALCGAFHSFAAVLAARAFTGAAAAALIPLTIAYIGDVIPYSRRQATLGMLMGSAGAAQALSTSMGGLMAAVLSWRSLFPILGGAAGLVTLALFSQVRRELDPPRTVAATRYRAALRGDLAPLLLLVFVEGALFMGGFPFMSGLLEERFGLNALAIGLILGLGGAAQVVAARLLPPLLRRFGEPELVTLGGGAMGVSYFVSAWAPHPVWVALGCTLLGGGFSVCHSTLQTRATEMLPAARGTALSLFAFSLFLGGGVGSLGLGLVLEHTGYGWGFGVAGLAWLPLTICAVRFLRRISSSLSLRLSGQATASVPSMR